MSKNRCLTDRKKHGTFSTQKSFTEKFYKNQIENNTEYCGDNTFFAWLSKYIRESA